MIDVTIPCSCPGKPHEQDTVSMPELTDVRIGTAVMAAMRTSPATVADMESAISTVLLHVAPRAWTLVDEKGEPLELTPENIDARLTWNAGGMEVAEKANDLYGAGSPTGVFAPLVPRKSKGSSNGRTGGSTSRTRTSGSRTRSSAKPSLRTVSGGQPSAAKAS